MVPGRAGADNRVELRGRRGYHRRVSRPEPERSSSAEPLPDNPRSPVSPLLVERFRPVVQALRAYHRHRAIGLEHIPRTGPGLIVLNHSLATYDGVLFCAAMHAVCGRWPASLGDDLIFRTPLIADFARRAGVRPANPGNGQALLEAGHLVVVAPGGMREALRPTDEAHTVRWGRRKGFVRLAIQAGAPLILVACPAADDLYTVYPSKLTARLYKRFKLPLPLARGLGPTPLPRPVRLTHLVGAPIVPPPLDAADPDGQVDRLHGTVVRRMDGLMRAAARR